jgi:hypothetical protein
LRKFRRLLVLLSALAASLGGQSADLLAARKSTKPAPSAAAAPSPECGGQDMLAELAIQDPAQYQQVVSEAAANLNGNALLWKIERAGTPASHLFGTIHLTDSRVSQVPAKARAALEKSKTVALEVTDLSPQTSALALSSAMKLAVFTDGTTLESMLPADDFEKVRKAVSKAGIPGEAARLFKPWIVIMLMSATECERKKLQGGALVQDMRIAAIAKKRKAALIGLETPDSQFEALASVPQQQQIDMLKSSLPYADRTQDLIETTLQLYLKHNIGAIWPFQMALARKAGYGDEAFRGFQQQLIIARNLRMRDRALPHLIKGSAFIAVGALHLTGRSGLVELFREAGYTVTPVE